MTIGSGDVCFTATADIDKRQSDVMELSAKCDPRPHQFAPAKRSAIAVRNLRWGTGVLCADLSAPDQQHHVHRGVARFQRLPTTYGSDGARQAVISV
jgi:hypothetical protein